MSDRKNLVLIATCVLIVSLPLISSTLHAGHDVIFHTARLISISEELPRFPVQMYPSWLYDFGEPVGIFYPSLFLYPFAILLKLGFSIVFVSQSLYIFIIILAAICSFVAGRIFFDNDRLATIFSICYITAWYFQLNIFVRCDIGEALAMAFLPLAISSSRYLISGGENNRWIITVLAYTGIIQSHILTTLLLIGSLIALWIFEMIRQKKFRILDSKTTIKIFLATLCLNAFFIVPFLIFYFSMPINVARYPLSSKAMTLQHVSSVFLHAELILIPLILTTISRISSIKSRLRRIFLISLAIGIFFCFMATDKFPWTQIESIPFALDFLSNFQFPWRFMCLGTIFLTLVATVSLSEVSRMFRKTFRFIAAICISLSIWSITFGGHDAFGSFIDDRFGWFKNKWVFFYEDLKTASFESKTSVIRKLYPIDSLNYICDDYVYRGIHAEDLREWKKSLNDPRISKIEHRYGKIFVEYDLDSNRDRIELPILYFPGYESSVEIESSERHLIQIDPKNLDSEGTIEISYEGLPSFKIANIISLATLIFLLV